MARERKPAAAEAAKSDVDKWAYEVVGAFEDGVKIGREKARAHIRALVLSLRAAGLSDTAVLGAVTRACDDELGLDDEHGGAP